MTISLLALVFAVLWMVVGGSFTLSNLLLGLSLSYFSLWLVRGGIGGGRYLSRARRMIALGAIFARELALSAVRVAATVLSPRLALRPGIVAVPLRLERDGEIALLANMITLTPGTLSLDVSDDRKTLFVHALDARDPDGVRRDIREGFEARVRAAFEAGAR